MILCPKGADIGSECRLFHLYAPPAQNNIIREAPEQSTVGLPVVRLDYFSTNRNLIYCFALLRIISLMITQTITTAINRIRLDIAP